MNDIVIKVSNLQKHFGELEVLKGIDAEVRKGEVLVIIGPSGAGKSTFLRCLNFLEEYDHGEVLFGGQLVGYRKTAKGRLKKTSASISLRFARAWEWYSRALICFLT